MSAWRLVAPGPGWSAGWVWSVVAALLAGSAPVAAQPVEAAGAAPPGVPEQALSIWYRSSEGCPDGAAFVARLSELGREAELARVGDHIDFVVTVAAAPSTSSGRLERQTARGTVAIRELVAGRCEEVTEALALSLELALAPASAPAEEAAEESALAPALAERGVLQLGAQGSVVKGVAPSWAPGGALFAELRPESEWALAGRLSLAATIASDTVASIEVDVLSLAARAEGCALELRAGVLSVQPCAGAELGLMRADSSGDAGRTDSGFWGAGVGVLRASAELHERFALEAQVGAAIPFVRYAVGSSRGGDLFRTEAVLLALGLGARWAP